MSNTIRMQWDGEHRFDAGRPGGATIRMDGDGTTGPSPLDTLLCALAGCTAVDVVDILAKRRTPVKTLTVDVVGERVENVTPRRFKHITLQYTIAGEGIERIHAERAIDLAVNKYCSVRDSLRVEIQVDWELTLVTAAP